MDFDVELGHLPDRFQPVRNGSDRTNFSAGLGYCHSNRLGMDIALLRTQVVGRSILTRLMSENLR